MKIYKIKIKDRTYISKSKNIKDSMRPHIKGYYFETKDNVDSMGLFRGFGVDGIYTLDSKKGCYLAIVHNKQHQNIWSKLNKTSNYKEIGFSILMGDEYNKHYYEGDFNSIPNPYRNELISQSKKYFRSI